MARVAKNFGLALLCTVLVAAARADHLSDDLNRDYQKHVLGVRHPIHSGTQEFDGNGNPTNAGAPQDWEVYGGVLIEKVQLKKDRLRIEALRVAPSDRMEKGKPAVIPLAKKTSFEIHLQRPLVSVEEARAVLGAVFYLDESDVEHRKPELRRAHESTKEPAVYDPEKEKPQVSFPKPRYTPEPEFSEVARRKRIQGVELLTVIVNPEGEVSSLKIDRGLGYGLDQSALDAVKMWRFMPAIRNGQPVSVKMRIEVDFHLY